jgi:hypothetical protein
MDMDQAEELKYFHGPLSGEVQRALHVVKNSFMVIHTLLISILLLSKSFIHKYKSFFGLKCSAYQNPSYTHGANSGTVCSQPQSESPSPYHNDSWASCCTTFL